MKNSEKETDWLVKDLIESITESFDEKRDDNSDFAMGQKLAYVECLEILKGLIAGDEERFGLDGDLEKKFGLI
ncbi:MAG: hypothetical protein IJ373_06545 [Clostridia bacterium]|nr:hypothetical protein [Clostridia bacterium]MBQ8446358.1 hypothetical protein [Clostridia bacterium]